MRISDWSSDVCSSDLPSLAPPGIMLGIGLGGFFDGIVLHQIFQAHAMLSAVIPLNSMMNMKANMLADGLFHAFMWMAKLIGVRSEEHTSELQSLMRNSYAVFCLQKQTNITNETMSNGDVNINIKSTQ